MPRAKATSKPGPSAPDGERVELKRVRAGAYRTVDGRFSVEQESGRWLVVDTGQTDELGLPRVRGPFATLDDARGGIVAARVEPTPQSPLGQRMKEGTTRPKSERSSSPPPARRGGPSARRPDARSIDPEPAPGPPEVVARRLRPIEGSLLRRALEADLGTDAVDIAFDPDGRPTPPSEGDARRFLGRPDGHVVIALEDERIVGLVVAAETVTLREPGTLLFVERWRTRAERRDEIGTALLEALGATARSRAVASAVLVVDADAADALSGFAPLSKGHGAPDRVVVDLDLRLEPEIRNR